MKKRVKRNGGEVVKKERVENNEEEIEKEIEKVGRE